MAVSQGQLIPVTDLAGNLRYQGPLNASGNGLSSFTFQVKDDGGTPGVDLEAVANAHTITFNVGPRSTIRSWAPTRPWS